MNRWVKIDFNHSVERSTSVSDKNSIKTEATVGDGKCKIMPSTFDNVRLSLWHQFLQNIGVLGVDSSIFSSLWELQLLVYMEKAVSHPDQEDFHLGLANLFKS